MNINEEEVKKAVMYRLIKGISADSQSNVTVNCIVSYIVSYITSLLEFKSNELKDWIYNYHNDLNNKFAIVESDYLDSNDSVEKTHCLEQMASIEGAINVLDELYKQL